TVITDKSGSAMGKKVEITFTTPAADGTPQYAVTIDGEQHPGGPHAYNSPDKLLAGLGIGVEVNFSGEPAENDSFTLVPLSSSYSVSKSSSMAVANVSQFNSSHAFTLTYNDPGYTVSTDGPTLTATASTDPSGRQIVTIE